ncbi:16S rRNA (guanine(966)-N(2))-methyltransferase RsmD [Alkaliphilus peptidifermentans]|uniref:16S rRNA (Guanine(966)-N(2))-methyltransferase RsmD n=1 Tax=Alkaliphilus peptidifermentans DSM 18978 TaxID=1120976 RepID=A0A1G5JB47_9FIRM|nr:16S rRNA (guanine(966)-N(2))-methyltransferase RsmD [Alkaliphilus peptidifermentans]SCY85170.1 16S rRNA (guanine(966)-N(2))-methyltransferase RsmD [Alkaliphilus peptidifermentans DSM 18978]
MRIIAGKAKGHRLMPPKGIDIRPTSDRVKESIFNVLQATVIDSIVIDLFSGTGNLGIEALSRGAEKAYLVDQSPQSINVIEENLLKTRQTEFAEVIKSDAVSAIIKLTQIKVRADLIFMDPPYGKDLIIPTLEAISTNGLLKKEGIIVVEHDKDDPPPEVVSELVQYRSKKFGNTCVSFYRLREEA